MRKNAKTLVFLPIHDVKEPNGEADEASLETVRDDEARLLEASAGANGNGGARRDRTDDL